MKTMLTKVWKDIRTGENIDLYLTIVVASVVALMGIFGKPSFEILSSTILAVLAIISGALLSNRRTTSDLKDYTANLEKELVEFKNISKQFSDATYITLEKGYPDLSAKFKLATRISIIGETLNSTTRKYFADFEDALKRGSSVRIAVCEPSDKLMDVMRHRTYMLRDADLLKTSIENHLALMQKLQSVSPKQDLLEVRLIPTLLPFGLIVVDFPDKTTEIFVKLIVIRTRSGGFPTFQLSNSERNVWFQFFADQFEEIWKLSAIFELTSDEITDG